MDSQANSAPTSAWKGDHHSQLLDHASLCSDYWVQIWQQASPWLGSPRTLEAWWKGNIVISYVANKLKGWKHQGRSGFCSNRKLFEKCIFLASCIFGFNKSFLYSVLFFAEPEALWDGSLICCLRLRFFFHLRSPSNVMCKDSNLYRTHHKAWQRGGDLQFDGKAVWVW